MSPSQVTMSGSADGNSPSSSTASKATVDILFEPSVDMMVNDFDDERTLEEEEALAAIESEDPNAELSSLQREGDMPIEELLALYNCAGPTNTDTNRERSSSTTSTIENGSEEQSVVEEEPSELRTLYPETYNSHNNPQRLLRTISRPPSGDEEEDGDYSPDEDDYKKTIMVGSDYQAFIPEGLCKYDDALPYENEDKLLWDPSILIDKNVEEYLVSAKPAVAQNASSNSSKTNVVNIPQGNHLRDDEQALHLLLQCGHNIEEALRRRRINNVTSSDAMSLWSEDECRNFENGVRVYGKDFHSIQQSKVRTRSVGELVKFYYLWKKTERHDVFANKARLEKKKYNLHPGLTDYMDRFLEEQESTGNGGIGQRDRSLSPNVNSHLLYANGKNQRMELGNSSKRLQIDPLAVGECEVFSGLTTSKIMELKKDHKSGYFKKRGCHLH